MLKSKAMEWVKALRSGKFKQTQDTLKEVDENDQVIGHCCLGVLGEINKCDEEFLRSYGTLDSQEVFLTCGLKNDTGRPVDKMDNHVSIKIGAMQYPNLAEANDDGVSFKKIATWIEKNYKLL